LANTQPTRDANGNIFAVQIISQDITERRRAEEALRESEKRYRDLVETINEVIWEIDSDGVYSYLSPRVKDILGYEAKELLGEPFTDKMAPDEADHVFDIFMEIVTDPKPFMALETTPIRKDGFAVVIENSGKPFFSAERKLLGFRGVYRDITERKRSEELIRDLSHQLLEAQENERQIISRELHDTVAQDLSSSRISCEMLLKYKSLTPGIRNKISEISDGLRNTLMIVRNLSYYLKPPGLEQLGLTRTLYQFCKDYSEKTGIGIDFHSAGIDELDLNYDTKINLYRLVQEGLNNVRKHAGARKVVVKLVSSFPNIILRIEDDGKGFDLEKGLAKTSSEKRLGLRSMKERANLLQGRMDIKSISGEGTKIFITVPYSKENIGAEEDHIDH
jgi:PAS domain S-box-containing protein